MFGLALKLSHIPGAGKGLFTLKATPRNGNIARYTGGVKTLAQYNANPSGYAVPINRNRVVDATSTQSVGSKVGLTVVKSRTWH